MFSTGNAVPITRSNGIKYRKGDNQANGSAAGHRRAVRSRRSAASASRPVVALATLRRQAAANARATLLQHNISMPRFSASEPIIIGEGHCASSGASIARPTHVPAIINATIIRVEISTSAMVRVMIQWRRSGRARIKSAKPVSTSEAGSVASAMISARSAATIARSK